MSLHKLKKTANIIAVAIFLICTFFSICGRKDDGRWIFYVYMDGRGYYSYLPAIFIYHDLTFSFYSKASPQSGDVANFCINIDGKKVNKYFPGEAILLSPFFLAAHLSSPWFGYPANGYSQLYYFGVGLAAVFYLGLGLLFMAKLLRLFGFSEMLIALVMVMVVFATNLYHYSVYESSMSHVYSFALGAVFLYYVKKLGGSYSKKSLILAFIALLLSFWIRPVAGFLMLFTIPFLLDRGTFGFMDLLRSAFKDKLGLIVVFVIGGLAVFGQCYLWYAQTGHWVVDPYPEEFFDWLSPHTYDSLFSYTKGWLLYNPIMIFALLGLATIYRQRARLFFKAALFVLPMIYLISAWGAWGYGYCYGLRAYVDHYAFMGILLAFFLEDITSVFVKILTGILLLGILYLQQVQTWQAEHGIIHYRDMNESRYRSVFLKTDLKYENFFYRHPYAQTLMDTVDPAQVNESEKLSPVRTEKFTRDLSAYELKDVFFVDFESEKNILSPNKIIHSFGANSNASYKLDSLLDYSPTFHQKYSELTSEENAWIRASVQGYFKSMPKQKDLALVVCITSKGETIKYDEAWIDPGNICIGKWNSISMDCLLPPHADATDEVRVYCLNRGKCSLLIDDLKVELLEPKNKRVKTPASPFHP